MIYLETLPAVIDGTAWRIRVIDSAGCPGQRTLAPVFFKDGAWHVGTLGAGDDCGPYGLPGALVPLYKRNRFPIEAALDRKTAPQATLSILADLDREERQKAHDRMAQAAIDRAARAQALEDLDTAGAIAHGAGEDLPLFLAV